MRRLLAVLLALAVAAPAGAQLLPGTGSLIVSMTSPSNGATVSGTVAVSASVSIVGSLTVARVDFYADGRFIGSDGSAPYAVSWDSRTLANGSHTLSAVAQDALGVRWNADPVTVTVSNALPDTTAPSVSITSPANGATVSGTLTVAASASDDVGVAGVQFKANGANIGAEDSSAPYSLTIDTTKVADGSYTLTAVARDAAGNQATSAPVTVTVSNAAPADTTPPTVSITSPANGATVSGNVTVSASASDNVGVASVQFQLDGANAGAPDTSAPYSIPWDTTTVADGSHSITAVARDAAGNTRTSAPVTVTVANAAPGDTTPPAVSVTSPAGGATVSGTITVSASASDDVGVAGVQFQLDGANAGPVITTAPYELPWDTTGASDGAHTITAIAADAAGNQTTSASITVTVANAAPGDTTPPAVSVTSPASGATVSGTITVAASASDDVGVAGVQFLVDGVVRADDTSAPYSTPWDTTTVADGSHTITAVARDAAGNQASSAAVSVTVANAGGETTTRFEQDHSAVSAAPASAWATVGPEVAAFSGGTAGASRTAGATATFTFSGSAVTWIGLKCNACGIANVQIDGGAPVSVDTAGPGTPDGALVSEPLFSASGLDPAASHTLVITVTGETSSGNAYVMVDAFDVAGASAGTATRIEETGAGTSAAGAWALRGAETAAFSGGQAGSSEAAGATFTLDFSGTAVSWIGLKCSACGIATVSVDGGEANAVDTAGPAAPGSPGLASEPVFSASGLAAGSHRLVITVTGTTSTGGAHVIVDAFDVTP